MIETFWDNDQADAKHRALMESNKQIYQSRNRTQDNTSKISKSDRATKTSRQEQIAGEVK